MLSIGDDYWIENGADERVFKVNGKALRVRKTLAFEDFEGRQLLHIQERKLRVRDTMAIERDGESFATVRRAIVDHEHTFERDGREVAAVSKRWFRARDAYGIDIAPGEDDALIPAAAVCIDQMSHD